MSGCLSTLPNCSGGGAATRLYNEKPSGLFDCMNVSYTTAQVFDPATFVVRLDGIVLDPTQYTLGGDNRSFDLIVNPTDIKALNKAPDSEECLRVDYNASASSTGCITFL